VGTIGDLPGLVSAAGITPPAITIVGDVVRLRDTMNWIGMDRIMFSTDYPHWDFDDPRQVFKVSLTEAQKAMIFRDNAKAFYGLQ
jgi:predicted TIM-barrel fold metal-dependent hydrolase